MFWLYASGHNNQSYEGAVMTQIDEPIFKQVDDILNELINVACNYEKGKDVDLDAKTNETNHALQALIANQVREAVKEEKSIRAKLVTKAHKDGIADGLQMALYGVKDGSKEEKFIRHLLYSENIGDDK